MKDILVFGHENPDTDSIAAAIACAHYLNARGEDAEPVALGQVGGETKFALDKFGLEEPRIIDQVKGQGNKAFLVDHNEFQQSAADIEDAEIVGVIDHHKIANFETEKAIFYRSETLGSTCSIIAKLYKESEIDIPSHIAGIMLSAIISDTLLFKSPTCTSQDEEIARDLGQIAGLDDLEEYGMAMLKAGTNQDDKTAEQILEGDAKSYEFEDKHFRIGQVNVCSLEDLMSRKDELLDTMDDLIVNKSYSTFLLVITDILESNSIGLIRGSESEEIASIFDPDLEDSQIKMDGVVSRKKQVVPPITERFS